MFSNFLYSRCAGPMEVNEYEMEAPDHKKLTKRLKKTLYYGKMPSLDRPSLAMTELAVEILHDLAPRELGKVDMYWASEVSREACVSPCALVLAMVYLRRLHGRNSKYLKSTASSDLLLVAMMVASKYLHDEGGVEAVLNDAWAESGHLDTEEVNKLEQNFLAALDWRVFVSNHEFWTSLYEWEKTIACRCSTKRSNGYTYTELCTLSGSIDTIKDMISSIYEIMLVCAVSYCACVVTLYLSPFVLRYAQQSCATIPLSHSPVVTKPSNHVSIPPALPTNRSQDNIVVTSTETLPRRCVDCMDMSKEILVDFIPLVDRAKSLASVGHWGGNQGSRGMLDKPECRRKMDLWDSPLIC